MSANDPKRTWRLHCKISAFGKFGPEHRQTTLRLGLGRFVLQNVPVFSEQSVGHAHDIGCDPILRPSSVREPAVDDHVIAFGNDRARLISQGRWRTPDQIEQAIASGFDVRAVLDVVRRPKAFRLLVVPLVEQRIKRFEN
jgi:hypothetical protein